MAKPITILQRPGADGLFIKWVDPLVYNAFEGVEPGALQAGRGARATQTYAGEAFTVRATFRVDGDGDPVKLAKLDIGLTDGGRLFTVRTPGTDASVWDAVQTLLRQGAALDHSEIDLAGYAFSLTDGNPVKARGTAGDDELIGGSGPDQLVGDGGDDFLMATTGGDRLEGGPGVDTLTFEYHTDFPPGAGGEGIRLNGAKGVWRGPGGEHGSFDGIERIFGSFADDVMKLDRSADTVSGLAGDDRIFGRGGGDELHGGAGDDLIRGGGRDDLLLGEAGNDVLEGQSGDDQLAGGEGDDILRGGGGSDTLDGGVGADRLFGQGGADVFVLTKTQGPDIFEDFDVAEDRIGLGGELTRDLISFVQSGADVIVRGPTDELMATIHDADAALFDNPDLFTVLI